MFKMGCSMARKILTIDGKGSSSSSAEAGTAVGVSDNGNNNNKKSKEASGSKQEELNDFSKLEEDPRLPLNVRQIFKITKSWKAIARTMSKTGTAMFLNLFEQNQDLFYLFERFQHLKGKELHESMELKEHAATVMSTLDQSINSLSDYDNFVAYLHSIGKLHRKVPGFKREHFWKIEQPFLKAVKQTLDERCNETIEEIYRIAIKLIIETISQGYGEDRPENLGDTFNNNDNNTGDKSGGAEGSNGGGGNQSDKADRGAGNGGLGKQRSSSNGRTTSSGDGKGKVAAAVAAPGGQHEQQQASITSNQYGDFKLEESRELEDRFKTTIICLKELLSLAVKEGVPKEGSSPPLEQRDVAGCELRFIEEGKKNKDLFGSEETEPEAGQSGGNRSVKAAEPNECRHRTASIGCGTNKSDEQAEGSRFLARKEEHQKQQNRRQRKRQMKGLLGRLLFTGLDRLFAVVNRKKREAGMSKSSTTKTAKLHEEEERQWDEQSKGDDASKQAVYLIERGKLNSSSCPRDDDIERACVDRNSILQANYTSERSKKLANLCCPARQGSHELLSRPTAAATGDLTSSCASSMKGSSSSSCNVDRESSQWRQNHEELAESPRSIGGNTTTQTTTTTTTTRRVGASVKSKDGCQLAKLSRPNNDDDDDDDDYDHDTSRSPCNETNSHHQVELAAVQEQKRKQEKPVQATVETLPGAFLTLRPNDMHSRDRNNNHRDNLEGQPNEQQQPQEYGEDGEKISIVRQAWSETSMRPICSDLCGGGRSLPDVSLDERGGGGGACLTSRLKQSSSSSWWLANRRRGFMRKRLIVMLSSRRGHGKNHSQPSAKAKPLERPAKVNENKDLMLRVNGCVGGLGNSNEYNNKKPMGNDLNNSESSRLSQFAMSNHHKQQQQQQLEDQTQLASRSLDCPQQTTTSQPPRQAARPAQRLTSNTGDLGELIKMLMLTLLISSSSDGNNNNVVSNNNRRHIPISLR